MARGGGGGPGLASRVPAGYESPMGREATCQAEHGGTFWTVRNDGDTPIPSGTRVRIASVNGLTLLVRPDL